MDAAWFGKAAPLPSVLPARHAEAAAASASPNPQQQQVSTRCPAPSSDLQQVRSAVNAGLACLPKTLGMCDLHGDGNGAWNHDAMLMIGQSAHLAG